MHLKKNTATLNLSSLNLMSEYRTGQCDLMEDFYLPCLELSSKYDRAVGYFRSTIFHLIYEQVSDFALRGGKIRIVCSPDLSAEDVKAIEDGYTSRESAICSSLEHEIDLMLNQSGLLDKTKALATLVAHGVIDLKIAVRPGASGMYHDKLGIFSDNGGNFVSFRGSANETWNAWHEYGNYESLEVFCSWKNGGDHERVNNHIKYFEELWDGKLRAVEVYDFPTAARKKLCSAAEERIEDIDWAKFKKKPTKKANTRSAFPHQTEAITNWAANNYRGILEHATGSGKTFTAMIALKEHVLSGNPAIVLVPSKLLLRQWAKEMSQEIPEATVLKAGDGNTKWKSGRILRDFTVCDPSLNPRIILSTIQTASSDDFIRKIDAGEHLLIVADECHQTGSAENSNIYRLNAGKRLGLSATPIRYGDPDGTSRMMNYFGGVVQPKFTLDDAIRSGRLVEYEYHPYAVNLTAEEADAWKELSNRIKREAARSPKDREGKLVLSETTKLLLIKRSRIAKKAANKEKLALKILEEQYQEGEKWLVYCEDKTQLASILKQLKSKGMHVNEYHTSMDSDMDATLDWFRKHGGILVSIRCLDEGVDIPDISHALVLASSQNPRQFIQRRGRVLRKAPEKVRAVLHDALVVPINVENEVEQLSLVKSEFCRAIEFANGAINRSAASSLRLIAIELGLDVDELANAGEEEKDDE